MKFYWSAVVVFAALAVCQDANKQEEKQKELVRALELLKTMPQCAQTCLLEEVAASGQTAANLDIKGSCANTTAAAFVAECASKTCTIREQLTAKNITETLCRRPVRQRDIIPIPRIIGFCFATVAYFARMASKVSCTCERGARIDTDYWWDDAVISFAFALVIPITIISFKLAALGIGADVWTIPFDNITEILKLFYFCEMMYFLALPGVKVAILLTYLRIFQSESFRRLVYGALALNVAYSITFVVVTAFQCSPVDLAWFYWDKTHPGRCNNTNAQSWAAAALNIALDVVVVVLPMPMLWRMDLNKRKKILVMLMFGVGFFVTIVSILRLQILVEFGDSKNVTHDYKALGYWSIVEIHTAVVCACMPGIRNLIRRSFPRLMGQTKAESKNGTGLSGRTAVSSNLDKNGTESIWRTRHSDDEAFFPLEDISINQLAATRTAPLPPEFPEDVEERTRPNSCCW